MPVRIYELDDLEELMNLDERIVLKELARSENLDELDDPLSDSFILFVSLLD